MPNINLNNVESTTNKSTNVNTDQASNTKYPSVKAVFDWASGLFAKLTGATFTGNVRIPNLGINADATTAKTYIKGSTDANTEVLIDVESLSNQVLLVRSDGIFSLNQSSPDSSIMLKGNVAGNDIVHVQKNNDHSVMIVRAAGNIEFYNANAVHSNIINGKTALGLGATEAEARLHVRGTSTGDDVYSLIVENSAGSDYFRVDDAGDVEATSRFILAAETANTIAHFDANKAVKSLSTSTYPSLTELSYVKGVTSAVQTQINNRAVWTLNSDASLISPADASVYYSGNVNNITPPTTNLYQWICPIDNAILKITFTHFIAGTLGSSEGATIKLYNSTKGTNETLTTNHLYNARVNTSYLTSSIDIDTNDRFYLEITNPTWATNPVSVYTSILVNIC